MKQLFRAALCAVAVPAISIGSAVIVRNAAEACEPERPVAGLGAGDTAAPTTGPNYGGQFSVCVGGPGGTKPVDQGVTASVYPQVSPTLSGPGNSTGVSAYARVDAAVCNYIPGCQSFYVLPPTSQGVGAGLGNPQPIVPALTGGGICFALGLICPSGGLGIATGGVDVYTTSSPMHILDGNRYCAAQFGAC